MTAGGQTPEELETLLEDAFVLRDALALARLFQRGGILAVGGQPPACGRDSIARTALPLWAREHRYLAAPRQIYQVRDTALVISDSAVNVARRGRDRSWRYAVAALDGPA